MALCERQRERHSGMLIQSVYKQSRNLLQKTPEKFCIQFHTSSMTVNYYEGPKMYIVQSNIDFAQSALTLIQDLTGVISYNLTSNNCKEQGKKNCSVHPALVSKECEINLITIRHQRRLALIMVWKLKLSIKCLSDCQNGRN